MVVEKINGRVVSAAEMKQWQSRRRSIFGKADWSKMRFTARTNDTFMRGRKDGNQLDMDDDTIAAHKAKAAREGVSLTGKDYWGSLANGPMDLEAWCGSDSEVIAKAKKERVAVTVNGVKYDFRDKYRDVPDDEPYKVADCVVDEEFDRRVTEIGEKLSDKELADLREKVVEEITPNAL